MIIDTAQRSWGILLTSKTNYKLDIDKVWNSQKDENEKRCISIYSEVNVARVSVTIYNHCEHSFTKISNPLTR